MAEDQQVLFTNGKSIKEVRIEAAKEILISEGYRIIAPIVVDGRINSKRKLCDYFYMRLDSKHPNRQHRRLPNPVLDMKTVSKFVDSQMIGTNEKTAIQDCVAIVDLLFDYEEYFRFKYPIADISILAQGKMSWITEKAVELLNRKRYEKMEIDFYRKVDKIENSYEIDSKEMADNLDDLLKKMEADNGKKERRGC